MLDLSPLKGVKVNNAKINYNVFKDVRWLLTQIKKHGYKSTARESMNIDLYKEFFYNRCECCGKPRNR